MKPEDSEVLKELLSTKEALGVICFSKHHNGRINTARLSEMLKIPVNKLKDTCSKMEELNAVKMHRVGPDTEVELLDKDNEELKKVFDEVIWQYKDEYGKIYKRLITAELLDFMGDK